MSSSTVKTNLVRALRLRTCLIHRRVSEKPDVWWVESAEAEGVIQDPCLVDTIVLPGALIYRTTPQVAFLKMQDIPKIHKAVPEHRIHQQF